MQFRGSMRCCNYNFFYPLSHCLKLHCQSADSILCLSGFRFGQNIYQEYITLLMTTIRTNIKFTYEDYLGFPDDGNRHEIIDGEHYVTPAPLTKHQRILANLLGHLYPHCSHTKAGLVLAAPTDVVFSKTDIVQPDLLFVAKNREHIVTRENIQGAPDFIIEILSDSTRLRDERTKRTLYERFRVKEYWLIDPELETVKIFRLHNRRYSVPEELNTKEPNSRLSPSVLPGFLIAIQDIFL